MRLPICHVRILIFAFSLACMTTDALLYINLIFIHLDKLTVEVLDFQGRIIVFSLTNDLLSLLFCGYYLIRIEYMWNNAPKILDFVVCGIEFVLWIIYVYLRSKLIAKPGATFAYGILNIISYFVLVILFFEFHRRSRKFGKDKLTPLSNTNNNSGVEPNNTIVEIHENN